MISLKLLIDVDGVAESRLFNFQFANKLDAGDSLSSAQVEVTAIGSSNIPLTVSQPVINGAQVQIRITAPPQTLTAGQTFGLTCTCPTANGDTLVVRGRLRIDGP